MKLSLISATSFFALLTAATGPAQATPHATARNDTTLLDLLPDAAPPGAGGLAGIGVIGGTLRTAGFTGQRDPDLSAMRVFPLTPLGAVPGTDPFDEGSLYEPGGVRGELAQTARTTAAARVAVLIGSVPSANRPRENSGATVLMASGGAGGFNESPGAAGPAGASLAYAFASSSTGTATITVAAVGNLTRPGLRPTPYVVATSGQDATTLASGGTASALLTTFDSARPGTGYTYAPSGTPSGVPAAGSMEAASFSDTIRASGNVAGRVVPSTTRTSERATPAATSGVGTLTNTLAVPPAGAAASDAVVLRSVPGTTPATTPGQSQQTSERGGPVGVGPAGGAAARGAVVDASGKPALVPASFVDVAPNTPLGDDRATDARGATDKATVTTSTADPASPSGASPLGPSPLGNVALRATPKGFVPQGFATGGTAAGAAPLASAAPSGASPSGAGGSAPGAAQVTSERTGGTGFADAPAAGGKYTLTPASFSNVVTAAGDLMPLPGGNQVSDLIAPPTSARPTQMVTDLVPAGYGYGTLSPTVRAASAGPQRTDISLNLLPPDSPSEVSIEAFPIFTLTSAAGVQSPAPASVDIPLMIAANASPGLLNSPLAMPVGQVFRFDSAAGILTASVPEPGNGGPVLLGSALLGLMGLRRVRWT